MLGFLIPDKEQIAGHGSCGPALSLSPLRQNWVFEIHQFLEDAMFSV